MRFLLIYLCHMMMIVLKMLQECLHSLCVVGFNACSHHLAQPFATTSCVLQEAISCKTCGHGWPTQKETREAIQCRVGTQVRSKDCVLSIFWGRYCLANNVCAYGKLAVLFRIKDMAHPCTPGNVLWHHTCHCMQAESCSTRRHVKGK